MMSKKIFVLGLFGFFLLLIMNFCSAATIYNITGCTNLTQGGIYHLNQSVNETMMKYNSSNGCIDIQAPNITLDCRGFFLRSNSTYMLPIIYTNSSNITIKNCNLTSGSGGGISLEGSHNSTIFNNTIYLTGDSDTGIELTENTVSNINSSFNNITLNNITGIGDYDYGIVLNRFCMNNTIFSNFVNTTGASAWAFYTGGNSTYNNISFNTFITYGADSWAMNLNSGKNTILNNTLTTKGDDAYGISLYYSYGSIIKYNNINSSIRGINFHEDNGIRDKRYNSTITNNTQNNGEIFYYFKKDSETISHKDGSELTIVLSDNITLTDINLTNGMFLKGVGNSTIENSNILNSSYYGLYITINSTGNILKNSAVSSNKNHGIYIDSNSGYNNFTGNNIFVNTSSKYGVYVRGLGYNNFSYNKITTSGDVGFGLYLYRVNSSVLFENNITVLGNTTTSLVLASANYSSIYNNILKTTASSVVYPFYLREDCYKNLIYNNIFNGSDSNYGSAVVHGTNENYWNTTKSTSTNIAGGSHIGGNYYAMIDGTGFSETCTDSKGDGICNLDNTLNTSNIDYLPLACSSCTPSSTTTTTTTTESGGTAGTSSITSWSQTFTASTSELENEKGYTKKLGISNRVKFKISNNDISYHSVGIKEISDKTVKIEVASTPQTATLSIGDERRFDVDDDGEYYDVYVKLNAIEGTEADLTIKKINEKITDETIAEEEEKESEAKGEGIVEEKETTENKFNIIYLIIGIIILIVIAIIFFNKNKK